MEGDNSNWRILRNDKVGRYVVAGRDLQASEIIFSEVPFVYGPKADTPPLCLGCYAPVDAASTPCPRCNWPMCSAECHETPAHKNAECLIFQKGKVKFQQVKDYTTPCAQYDCILPLRLLLKTEESPKRWETEVSSMEGHDGLRQREAIWQINQTNIVDYLRGPCKLGDRFSEQLIHTICGIIEINAFEGRSTGGYAIRAIYPRLAMMSHNCVSNTTHSIVPVNENGEEFRMYVRAATKVPKDGELFASYTHSLLPTMLRREHLKEGKYFDCECPRCSDPRELGTNLSTLKCTKCDNGVVLSTQPLDREAPWKCTHCAFEARGDTIRRILGAIQANVDLIEAQFQGGEGIEEREKLLRKYRSVLHPKHAFLVMLKHSLSQMYGRVDGYMLEDLPDILLERKVEFCQQLLEVIDVVEPGHSRLRGMTLYELHAPLILLARNERRAGLIDKEGLRKKLEEAVRILEEAAGILEHEPACTPEGIIGQVAGQSLQQLKENVDAMIENS